MDTTCKTPSLSIQIESSALGIISLKEEVPSITASVDMNVSSLAEACAIGAEAEIANFGLYDQWIATVSDYPDLVQVFTALRNASEFSHLPAFQACAG